MFEGTRAVTGQVMVSEAAAAARADESELEFAVREHARLVYRVAYSVLRNHHDAEDATQETFIRVLRHKESLPGIRDLRAWLARVAWRVAVDRTRKVNDAFTDEIGEAITQIQSLDIAADEIVVSSEMSKMLENLITALPTKLRDPLVLSALEEMTPPDISKVLAISEAAVRSRVFRARQIVRERLAVLLEGKRGD